MKQGRKKIKNNNKSHGIPCVFGGLAREAERGEIWVPPNLKTMQINK